MEAPLVVTFLWLMFFGTHVGLATRQVRGVLVDRLGAHGFFVLYSVVASVTFAILVAYYAAHRFEGPAGLALGASEPARWLLMAVITCGVVLAGAGLGVYPRTPMALFDQPIRSPRGIEKVTRHSFFVGTALLALAHLLLATKLVGAIFMGGFAVLAIVGARHQDQKLLARRGEPYRAYLASTSLVPFAALLSGRQRLAAGDFAVPMFLWGLVATVALRLVHAEMFAHGGAWVIGALLGGALLATLQSWRRKRRHAAGIARSAPARGGAA